MKRRRQPTALTVLLALTIGSVSGYLFGRGLASPPDDVPASSPSVVSDEEVRAAHAERVRFALREIDGEDARLRARSLRALFDAGYDHTEILALVVRPNNPEWQGRAFADLLSSEPDATFRPVLRRISRTAQHQRAGICQALGAPRSDTAAASAILAVRALLDGSEGVREAALASLRIVDPAAAEVVLAHYAKGHTLADGSVSGLDASLLIEEGAPYAEGASRSMLVEALKADGSRFGAATVIRVGAILALLPDGETWLLDALRELTTYDRVNEDGASLFASVGPVLVPVLRRRLLDPDAPAFVVRGLGELGPDAKSAVPDLLPLIHDEEMGSYVAWAFGEMEAASPRVVEALCTRLAHRVTLHDGGYQAEGALKRLLASGHGIQEVAALLQGEDPRLLRAAVRVMSLCHARDCVAAEALLEELRASTSDRSVRRSAVTGLRLLRAEEDVRRAELERQVSSLRRALEAEK